MKPSEFDAVCKLFQNASNGFKRANPGLTPIRLASWEGADVEVVKWPKMNKTEMAFALRLEAQRRAGEVDRYEYEGITLRWADMRYTPDFVVFSSPRTFYSIGAGLSPVPVMVEVKGGFIRDRSRLLAGIWVSDSRKKGLGNGN